MFTVSRPTRAGACAARPMQSPPCRGMRPICRAESENNPLEAAGDAIKEVGQKFADAQKMPDLGSMDELTKDGAFYTVKNDNPLVKDTTARNLADGKAADIPFGETGSKGSKPGSDSTKPSVAENVEKVVKNITGQE